jgi:ankyrin repeat protein
MVAAHRGHASAVQVLLDAGADVNARNKVRCASLISAVRY